MSHKFGIMGATVTLSSPMGKWYDLRLFAKSRF